MQKIGFCERYTLTTAVLNRAKELTRRLEKALERAVAEYEKDCGEDFEIICQKWDDVTSSLSVFTPHGMIRIDTCYKIGEVVAVAQSYKSIHEEMMNGDYGNSRYDAFRCAMVAGTKGWDNKMFVRADLMPHQIQITGVRVERLQDISDEECMKEGIKEKSRFPRKKSLPYYFDGGKHEWDNSYKTPREAFATLINRPGVGRKGLWESNPWVVVYKFRLVK